MLCGDSWRPGYRAIQGDRFGVLGRGLDSAYALWAGRLQEAYGAVADLSQIGNHVNHPLPPRLSGGLFRTGDHPSMIPISHPRSTSQTKYMRLGATSAHPPGVWTRLRYW